MNDPRSRAVLELRLLQVGADGLPQQEGHVICTSFKEVHVQVPQQGSSLDSSPFTAAFAEACLRTPPDYNTLQNDSTGVAHPTLGNLRD